MPWFEFDDDTVEFAQKASAPEKRQAWTEYRTRMIEEMNLEVKAVHGKARRRLHLARRPTPWRRAGRGRAVTRKSFVVHYTRGQLHVPPRER